MRIHQSIIAAFIVLGTLPSTATAQANSQEANEAALSRNITVEREYSPSTINAKKVSLVPPTDEYRPDAPDVEYIEESKTEKVETKIKKIASDKYEVEEKIDAKKGLFKAGVGAYWQVLGEFYYPLVQNDKQLLDINIKHNANYGAIKFNPDYNPRAMSNTTDARLSFENQFKSSNFSSSAHYSFDGFDYYGLSDIDPLTTGNFSTAGIDFKLYSTNTRKSTQYDMSLAYEYFGSKYGINQHDIKLALELEGKLDRGSYLGANLAADVNLYATSNEALATYYNVAAMNLNPAGLIRFEPYYKIVKENWNLKLGGKLFGLIEDGSKFPITGSADIEGNFGIIPELFYLNIGISGDMNMNSYATIMQENKYISPDLCVGPTYTPLDAKIDIKAKVMKGLLFEVGANYQLILDQYFYVNKIGVYLPSMASTQLAALNTFDAVVEPTSHKISARAGLYYDQIENLEIGLSAQYNYWIVSENAQAWQEPNLEIELKGSYNFLEKWQVGASYTYLGGRYALVPTQDGSALTSTRMTDIHDVNVWASYKVLDWLSVFANLKNIANIKADNYYGYRNFGINAMAGATLSF